VLQQADYTLGLHGSQSLDKAHADAEVLFQANSFALQ
jgi:hypothetical protein